MQRYIAALVSVPLLLNGAGISAAPDSTIPTIAGPTEFNAILIDETFIELSWNDQLLDGSSVNYYQLWNGQKLIAQTSEPGWQINGIDRNRKAGIRI